jgi:hypothetical protein
MRKQIILLIAAVYALSTAAQVPDKARVLIAAYPSCIKEYKDGYLVMQSGKKILFDDKKEKDFETVLDQADPEDMLRIPYDTKKDKPDYLEDAGRIRCDEFLREVYGGTQEAVRANLVTVNFCGQKVQFTKVNGASKALQAVSEELQKLPNYASLKKYLGSGGTFVYRKVRGANRLSAHSFGIAIDIGYDKANKKNLSTYWKWDNGKAGELTKIGFRNSIPMDIVRVFEKHGFVWGGRWYHYDTMHFEYRPEYFAL